MKIHDIANKVGFVDTNYFSKAFKEWYGVTPKVYRKKHFEKHRVLGKKNDA